MNTLSYPTKSRDTFSQYNIKNIVEEKHHHANTPCEKKNIVVEEKHNHINISEKKHTDKKKVVEKTENNDINFNEFKIIDNMNAKTQENEVVPEHQVSTSEFNFEKLSLDDINTTFKVVGDLAEGEKLKVVDNKFLAVDNSYSFTRSRSGQGRKKLVDFLEFFFEEAKKNISDLLKNIRLGIDTDNKISELETTYRNMSIFLHRYDTVRIPYKTDSGVYCQLGNIRNKFFTFSQTFFRDMTLGSK